MYTICIVPPAIDVMDTPGVELVKSFRLLILRFSRSSAEREVIAIGTDWTLSCRSLAPVTTISPIFASGDI
ncbi:hypothetical protein NRB_07240 [Novosphingobium sp. 11B]